VPSPRSAPRIIRPLRDFLAAESAGAILLSIGAIAALVWANSPWSAAYGSLLRTDAGLAVGSWNFSLDLHGWVNDGLMALFFLVVGLEIKRELVEGELASLRQAALPAVAALGGMVVPALLFVAITAGQRGSGAWGIPMATDIALALGVVTVLGDRVPSAAKIFLLALAIVDDLGAIVVIALVYSSGVRFAYLAGAAVCVLAVVALGRWRPAFTLGFVVIGVVLWWFVHEAGLHATLAGVIMGFLTPTAPRVPEDLIDEEILADVSDISAAQETIDMARASVSRVEWLEHVLHPWTSLVIVPIFAFANAGLVLDGDAFGRLFDSRIALGVLVGLVVGKPLGIVGAVWLGRRAGLQLPDGMTMRTVTGLSVVAGIGFTVSIFVADLALSDPHDAESAKLAVMAASLIAAGAGALVLRSRATARPEPAPR